MNVLYVLAALLQVPQYPAPVGFVNDFAGILDSATQRQMTQVIREVREKSGGEIAVVTLRDLAGRASIDVARDIGRQWGVGAQGGPGDRAKNAGVVLLLVPGARPGDGKAQLAIATGRGAEGFITDARAGQIRDAIGRVSVDQKSYAVGLLAGVWLLGKAYADEFGFQLTGQPPVQIPTGGGQGPKGLAPMLVMLAFLFFVSLLSAIGRARYYRRYGGYRGGSGLGWLVLGMLLDGGGRRHGGWHGGWGGGGFGGGGFGGFGGGGGFSGGGASGSF